MGLSLPGNRLICLARDNLAPEKYERIIHPSHAWRYVESEYQFNDQGDDWRYIVNMMPIWNEPSSVYLRPNGRQAAEKFRAMLERGEVVCLTDISILPGDLFYINDKGALICRSTSAFRFDGAQCIIKAYNASVRQRDYRHSGGRPRPTPMFHFKVQIVKSHLCQRARC